MENNKVVIDPCPICKKHHAYNVTIEKDYIMQMMLSDSLEKNIIRTFTRLFTCPVELKDFQCNIQLVETSSERIRSISKPTLIKENEYNE